MQANDYDWTRFKRRVYIHKITIEILFQKWSTIKGLESWFIKKAEFRTGIGKIKSEDELLRVGDIYKWTYHTGIITEGNILAIEENKSLRFTFVNADKRVDSPVIVTVNLFKDRDGAGFDLVQENMTDSNYSKVNYFISCNMGWEFYMMNLKSILEAKNDLRILDGSRIHVDVPSSYPLENFSWTELTVKEYIAENQETAFQFWSIPSKLTQWFIKEALFETEDGTKRNPNEQIQSGDKYTWIFGADLTLKGQILEFSKNNYIIFTFGSKEPNSEEHVIVKVSFMSHNRKTLIIVHQTNIADNSFGQVTYNLSCHLGWAYYMTNLRSITESGYDLREKDLKKDVDTRRKNLFE